MKRNYFGYSKFWYYHESNPNEVDKKKAFMNSWQGFEERRFIKKSDYSKIMKQKNNRLV